MDKMKAVIETLKEEIENTLECRVSRMTIDMLDEYYVLVMLKMNQDEGFTRKALEKYKIGDIIFSERTILARRALRTFDCVQEVNLN
jgi:hypothetical protein